MSTWLLIVFVPIAVSWIARLIFPSKITWKEMAISIGIGTLITTAVS